jgi:hypothetical protein
MALGKEFFFEKFFAECSPSWHSAKKKVFFENFFAECPSARHSANKKDFFEKSALRKAKKF